MASVDPHIDNDEQCPTFDDNDSDDNQFFDAADQATTASKDPEANLLHERLNAQLNTNETVKNKSPGTNYFSFMSHFFCLSIFLKQKIRISSMNLS